MRLARVGCGVLVLAGGLALQGQEVQLPSELRAQVPAVAQEPVRDPSTGEETAQEPATPPEIQQPPVSLLPDSTTDLEEEALRLLEQILVEQNMLLAGQNFVYQAQDRRDPFRNLLTLRQRELVAPAERPVGLGGFMISEIGVTAVARYQDRWHALVQGMDQRTYFVEVGTALYDGRIIEINEQEVIFEQEVEDLLGARSARRVVKKLQTQE